jgi:hypothetical protein
MSRLATFIGATVIVSYRIEVLCTLPYVFRNTKTNLVEHTAIIMLTIHLLASYAIPSDFVLQVTFLRAMPSEGDQVCRSSHAKLEVCCDDYHVFTRFSL